VFLFALLHLSFLVQSLKELIRKCHLNSGCKQGNTPTLVKFQPQHIKNDNVSEALAPNILLSLSDDTCQSYTPSEDDGILRVSGFGTPQSRGQFQLPYETQSCSNISQGE
jgi:hypothetical protein